MQNDKLVSQLRLAADLLETGHPWEYYNVHYNPQWVKEYRQENSPLYRVANGFKIRPALATPPDGRPLHNPDNLTAEQVGVGWRLALPGEKLNANYDYWLVNGGWKKGHGTRFASELNPGAAMRLPLSVPWPEAKPDPYAELKKAHADGKVSQYRDASTGTPPFQLPPPPPGMQWHRADEWQEDDLPQGWRPLVEGETVQLDDSTPHFSPHRGWQSVSASAGKVAGESSLLFRTSRPLTFSHAGKTWTWHKPGDPMPCDGGAQCIGRFSRRNRSTSVPCSRLGLGPIQYS